MRLLLLIIILFYFSSCDKEDGTTSPVFDNNYGLGMYVLTDLGVNFYNYDDSIPQLKEDIFRSVNDISVNNARKIKFKGTKAYIISQDYIITTNVNTFENKGRIDGFNSISDIDFISNDRLIVLDQGDSKIKIVDLASMDITTTIEAGDRVNPMTVFSNSYKSFVLNGGSMSNNDKDTSVVVIQYRDNLVHLAEIIDILYVGENPNSAAISGNLKILSKGNYDPINTSTNTESSLSNVNQYNNEVYSTDVLTGIYNAANLMSNYNNTFCYFTALGGVYTINTNNLNTNLIINVNTSIINSVVHSYQDTDSTIAFSEMLYMNDLDNPNVVYQYNLNLSSFTDTITCTGNVTDIEFY